MPEHQMIVAAQAKDPLSLTFCLNRGQKHKTMEKVDDTSYPSECILLAQWVRAVEGAQTVPFHLIIQLLLSQADYLYPQCPLAKSHETPCSEQVLPHCMKHCIWLVQTFLKLWKGMPFLKRIQWKNVTKSFPPWVLLLLMSGWCNTCKRETCQTLQSFQPIQYVSSRPT